MFDFTTYICVLTWRYGTDAMRKLWSLDHRFHVQRQVWVAQVKAQVVAGLADEDMLAELTELIPQTDIEKVFEKERVTRHDIVAACQHFQDQAPLGGNKLHQGMTSEDNTSNLDIILLRSALDLVIVKLESVLDQFANQIDRYADRRCCGFTHWQLASTTTVGYRLAMYAQDLMIDLERLRGLRNILRPKGIKGAVGTCGTLCKMLEGSDLTPAEFEAAFLDELGLPDAFLVTGQTYPRKLDYEVLTALASLGQSLHKFAFDVRFLQSTPMNELSEPFRKGQKGSSAMPWKRNPINGENLDSLARLPQGFTNVAWINASITGLERTLDESGSRRFTLPISFLVMDECLKRAEHVIKGLVVKEKVIERNLATIGVFAGLEHMILYLQETHKLDRDQAYEVCQQAALEAWEQFESKGQHSLCGSLYAQLENEAGVSTMSSDLDRVLTEGANDAGDAPERARALANEIRDAIDEFASIP